MIEKCLYIDLMDTAFAKLHMLHQSSQLLKLFTNCGAELPDENFFRDTVCDQTSSIMMSYLETLIALNANQKSSEQTLEDTKNCETIETEDYGNLQILRNKSTQEVKFMNLSTNLECLQFMKQHEHYRKSAQDVVAKIAPVKEQYKFYGSQDATRFYAVNRKTKKCVDITDESNGYYNIPMIAKLYLRILRLLIWIGGIFLFFY
jgi:predicted metalloendopeptidase